MMNSTTAAHVAHFSWVDHTMFALMLVVSTVVGVLIGVCGKQDTKVDYLLGGKKMSVIPIAVSLIFSHISGITIVAVPAEFYTYGAAHFNQYLASIVTCVINYYIFLPIFFELQLTSTYEYLEQRFDKRVRTMASFLFALNVILFLPIVIYVPALAFNQVSGIEVHFITSVVCGVCMIYTMLGGMKAVVWTDFLQSFVTVGSCIAIIILGLVKVGGFNIMWDRSRIGGRLNFFDLNPDPFARNTFWTCALGNLFSWMSGLCVNQGMVQKFIALPTLKEARMSLMIFNAGFFIVKSSSLFIGLLIYSSYYECDPITSKYSPFRSYHMLEDITTIMFSFVGHHLQVNKADQILPFFTMDTASHLPGLPGLFIAGIFSASLSTLSSNFNCLSATISEDFVYPWIKGKVFESRIIHLVMKITVIVAGLTCILFVIVIEKMGGIIKVSSSTSGVTSGALLGMFVLGMFFPWANNKAAVIFRQGCLAGSAASVLFMAWIITGAQLYKTMGVERFPHLPMSTEGCEEVFNITVPEAPVPTALPAGMGDDAFALYRISFHYYCLVGTAVTVVVGLAVSCCTGLQAPRTVDARLLVSFMSQHGRTRPLEALHPSETEMLTPMATNNYNK